jgi:hypothetical protein
VSEYGRLWQQLWEVRQKIEVMTAPPGVSARVGPGTPETWRDANERVQARKDELDRLLAEWVEIEKRMASTPGR